MDALLKLFDKYRGHLKRESLSMGDFLEANYREYIDDVRVAMSPEDNPLLGDNICSMVENHISAIIENSKKLVEVHKLFEHGRIMEASNTAFEVFSSMKPQLMHRYSGAFRQETYYRIRSISDGSTFPLERKELFHIPYKKNYLVGTERYSMPGHPCLYLASQAELGWFECRKPTKFAIAKFAIPQDEDRYLKYIDFSEKLMPLKHSFFCWFHNEENKNRSNFPVNYKGEYHYRSGSTKQQLRGIALTDFLTAKTGIRWEDVPIAGVNVDDLDKDSFDIFRREAFRSKRMTKADLKMSNEELLDSLGLVTENGLKRAAILLFHRNPEKWVIGCYTKIGKFGVGSDLQYQDEVHGSLFLQADRVVELIYLKYLKAPITYDNMTRIETYPFPKDAVREALYKGIVA